MKLTKSNGIRALLGGLMAAAAVVLGACGPSASTSTTTTAPATTPPAQTTAAALTVNVATKADVGSYLVDSRGMSLYWFSKDSVGKSTPTGTVLANWPIFNVSTIVVPPSLKASDFTKITRDDGQVITAYKGWPLYYYIKDQAPGDILGNKVAGVWFLVDPASSGPPAPATTPATTTPPSTTTPPATTPATTTPPPAANYSVTISGFAFSPATLTVSAGATVTWTNKDSVAHTVTSDTGAFDSGNIAPNATFSYKFTTAGTFSYHCAIHPSMKASVVAQ